jgi:large subunit ribosomal protein L5
MNTRMMEHYTKDVVPALIEKFGYKNIHEVPRLQKVVLNTGLGEAVQNSKCVEIAQYALTQISGQKPVVTRARKSIAAFKLREGIPIGCMVTMRRQRMYDFLERLFFVALPRLRDFRGTPRKGFDGRGNYTMGIKEQIVFPEINIDKLDKIRGLDITFVTTAKSDEEARELLALLGMPFRN